MGKLSNFDGIARNDDEIYGYIGTCADAKYKKPLEYKISFTSNYVDKCNLCK